MLRPRAEHHGAASRDVVADVRLETRSLSEAVSEGPHRGNGQHWHLTFGGETVAAVAWGLPHPLAEALTATDHICFSPDGVDVEVDGNRIPD